VFAPAIVCTQDGGVVSSISGNAEVKGSKRRGAGPLVAALRFVGAIVLGVGLGSETTTELKNGYAKAQLASLPMIHLNTRGKGGAHRVGDRLQNSADPDWGLEAECFIR